MTLILECIVICFILLVPCVVAIANGIHNAPFLFEQDVQDRRLCDLGCLWHQWSSGILVAFLADLCTCYGGSGAYHMVRVFDVRKNGVIERWEN